MPELNRENFGYRIFNNKKLFVTCLNTRLSCDHPGIMINFSVLNENKNNTELLSEFLNTLAQQDISYVILNYVIILHYDDFLRITE